MICNHQTCLFFPYLSPQGTTFSSLEGIAQPIPLVVLCHYMPLWGLKSDRPPGFISDIPVELDHLYLEFSHNGQAEVGVVCLWVWLESCLCKVCGRLIQPQTAYCRSTFCPLSNCRIFKNWVESQIPFFNF